MHGESSGIPVLAQLVEQAGEDLSLLAGAVAVVGQVDYRSPAARVLRARLAAVEADALAARHAADRAAEELWALAAAVDTLPGEP